MIVCQRRTTEIQWPRKLHFTMLSALLPSNFRQPFLSQNARAEPTQVLITITVNTPTLSKSGHHDFSITIHATTDTDASLLIDSASTCLNPHAYAFVAEGITFKDLSADAPPTSTGRHVCYDFEGNLFRRQVRIPPIDSRQPYTVTHVMNLPKRHPVKHGSADPAGANMHPFLHGWPSHTDVLAVGHKYEFGLGNRRNHVQAWRDRGWFWSAITRRPADADLVQEKMPLILVNQALFEVVE